MDTDNWGGEVLGQGGREQAGDGQWGENGDIYSTLNNK